MDLALNNLQRLICHKTQPTKLYITAKKLNYFTKNINVQSIQIPKFLT